MPRRPSTAITRLCVYAAFAICAALTLSFFCLHAASRSQTHTSIASIPESESPLLANFWDAIHKQGDLLRHMIYRARSVNVTTADVHIHISDINAVEDGHGTHGSAAEGVKDGSNSRQACQNPSTAEEWGGCIAAPIGGVFDNAGTTLKSARNSSVGFGLMVLAGVRIAIAWWWKV